MTTNDPISPTPAVEGTCEKTFENFIDGVRTIRAHFNGKPHIQITGVCVNWKPLAPSLNSVDPPAPVPEPEFCGKCGYPLGHMMHYATCPDEEISPPARKELYTPEPSTHYACVYCNKPSRLRDADVVVDCYQNVCHYECLMKASPKHDLRKQDTPESKEHWDFVAEATARVEAMPEWKKNSVAVGGSPEAPAKDERFKIIVCGFDELPPEVDRDDLSNNGSGSEYASYLLVYLDGKLLRCESSAMEPEDVSFYRDLRWISQAIIEAWEAGKRARLGLSGRAE